MLSRKRVTLGTEHKNNKKTNKDGLKFTKVVDDGDSWGLVDGTWLKISCTEKHRWISASGNVFYELDHFSNNDRTGRFSTLHLIICHKSKFLNSVAYRVYFLIIDLRSEEYYNIY